MIMSKFKRVVAVLVVISQFCLLVGCGKTASEQHTITYEDDGQEVDIKVNDSITKEDIEGMDKVSFEELATAREGSSTDVMEGLVYQYVSDSVRIDMENLGMVTEETDPGAFEDITNVINEVNMALKTGNSSEHISDDILNYMLLEFANTPYTWAYDDTINPETSMPRSVDIKGMDAATHLYFVDVTYKTTSNLKSVLPTSTIVRGSENYEALQKKLYADYLVYISDCKDGDYYNYDEDGLPIFYNGHPAWDSYAERERAKADDMYNLIFAKRYTNSLYGWTDTETGEQVEQRVYMDYDVDEEGNPLIIYRDVDTGDVLFDEYTAPDNLELLLNGTVASNMLKYDDGSFEARWGSLEELYLTQSNATLMERLARSKASKDTIGVYTYPGLVESNSIKDATITFRFVLEYAYNIGVNDYMSVRSMYLYDYSIDNDDNESEELINMYRTDSIKSKEVLEPFVERTLNSYRRAVPTENHIGLNNLFVTYDKYDRYVADLQQYAYISNGGFIFEMIGRKGDEIACVVTQRVQKRAKGTNMTFPTYLEKSLIKLKLCDDDKVRIISTTLLDSEIVGEPMSIIREVSGISSQIEFEQGSFTATNEELVENCIARFIGNTAKLSDTASLAPYVDIGLTDTVKQSMKETLNTISAEVGDMDQIVVFIKNYPNKSNIYTKANLRIIYIKSGTPVKEVNGSIAVINRDSGWGVVNFTVDSMLDKTTVNGADGCFLTIKFTDTEKTYEFPKRETNEMIVVSNDDNSVNIHNKDEGGFDDNKPVETEQNAQSTGETVVTE